MPDNRADVESDELNAQRMRTDMWRRRFYGVWIAIGVLALFYVLGFVLDVLSTPVAVMRLTSST